MNQMKFSIYVAVTARAARVEIVYWKLLLPLEAKVPWKQNARGQFVCASASMCCAPHMTHIFLHFHLPTDQESLLTGSVCDLWMWTNSA